MIASRKKSTRRGITPIIAVILLLLMTVAAAGAAFLWITKFQGLVNQQVNKQLGSEQRCEGIKLSIDQVWFESDTLPTYISFTLRNAGTYNLKYDEWKVITVTGGVAGKTTHFANTLNCSGSLCTISLTNSSASPTWDVGASYRVTCYSWAGTDVEENDVYSVTAQPPCGTPATNSVVYTTG